MDTENMTDAELMKAYDEIVEEWDKSNTVFSLSDFEEIVLELESRCNK